MLDWISTNVKRERPQPKVRVQKKRKVYQAGKLVKKIGGRQAEPDGISDILKGLI